MGNFVMCEFLYRIRRENYDNGKYPTKGYVRTVKCNYSTKYCEIIAYNRKLEKKELKAYGLEFLCTMY
jgi:hypothetical protein